MRNMIVESSTMKALEPPRKTTRSHVYRGDIDGLRAIAVLAVLANHIDHALLPGGFLGVDMFFVISGFVITGSLLSRPVESFSQFLSSFYERRIRRIIPALLCCVIITFLASSLFITPGTTIASSTWQTGIWALFGASNIYLGLNSSDYFSASTALNPFTQTWSLGVEEQFYFIYPILFFVAFRASRNSQQLRRNLVLLICLAGAASLAGYLVVGNQMSWPYYSSPLRFWELASGCIACCMKQSLQDLHARLRQLASWLSFAICVASIAFFNDEIFASSTVLIVAGTAILIASGKSGDSLYKVLCNRFLRPIGLSSYSIYLWHWSVLSLARWTTGISIHSAPWILLAIVIFSYASYTFIETPLRRQPWMGSARGTFYLGAGSIITAFAILFGLRAENKSPLYIGKACKANGYETCTPKSSPHPPVTPHISNTSIQRNPCFTNALQTGLTAKFLSTCSTRRTETLPRLFVTGDSFAAALSPAVDQLYKKHKFNITYLTAPGCSFDIYTIRARRAGCASFNSARYSAIRKTAKSGDAVLISASSNLGYNKSALQTLQQLQHDLAGRNVALIVQQPMPRLGEETPDICYEPRQDFNNSNKQFEKCAAQTSIPIKDFLDSTHDSRIELSRMADGRGLFVWDPNQLICRDEHCYSHLGGIRLYRDSHHFSVSGAQMAAPSLQAILRRAGFLKDSPDR